ncbi:MAG TPA: hypothetical protein VFZ82_20685 [Methylomirabilota bacterium]|nr:hypothetical protein [Methylomirabilota bacterium]
MTADGAARSRPTGDRGGAGHRLPARGGDRLGERLAGGNVAVALLANTLATGAALAALILTFGT